MPFSANDLDPIQLGSELRLYGLFRCRSFFSIPGFLARILIARISLRRILSCPKQNRTRAPQNQARQNPNNSPKPKLRSTGKKKNIFIQRRNSKRKLISLILPTSRNSPRKIFQNVLTPTPISSTGTKSGTKLSTLRNLPSGNGSSAANSMLPTTALIAILPSTKTKQPSFLSQNPNTNPLKSSPIANSTSV